MNRIPSVDRQKQSANGREFKHGASPGAQRKAGELFREMERTPKADAGAKGNAAQGKDAPAIVAGASEYRAAFESSGVTERTAPLQRAAGRRRPEMPVIISRRPGGPLRKPVGHVGEQIESHAGHSLGVHLQTLRNLFVEPASQPRFGALAIGLA